MTKFFLFNSFKMNLLMNTFAGLENQLNCPQPENISNKRLRIQN